MRRELAMQAKPDGGPSSRAIRGTAHPRAVQRHIGLIEKGTGLYKAPWRLNGRKDLLMSDGKYPHLTILLTHLNEYSISGDDMWGLSFNQFHYSESQDDASRVTFVETSAGTWQPLIPKGQNYAKAKAAAALLMTALGHNLVDDGYNTWGVKKKPLPGWLDPEENDHVTPGHFFEY